MKKRVGAIGLLSITICLIATCFGFMLSGCTAQAGNNTKPANDSKNAVPVEWSMKSDCETCHTTEKESTTKSDCLASKHAAQTCTNCHNDDDTLNKVHKEADANKKIPKKLKDTKVENDVCKGCHDDKRITATATTTICTDANGKTVNPHDIPATPTHLEQVHCSDCHAMHNAKTATELAPELCHNCHHANVYQCGTCHE